MLNFREVSGMALYKFCNTVDYDITKGLTEPRFKEIMSENIKWRDRVLDSLIIYMKEKQYLRNNNGSLCITAAGIDHAIDSYISRS